MERRHKRAALVLLVVVLGAVGFLYFNFDFSALRFVGRRSDLDTMQALPTDIGYDYQPFRVANREDITIAGWWIRVARGSGTVLMAHGVGMNKSHMLSRAKVILEAGSNVMLIDLRARGESGGRMTSPGIKEAADVLAAVEYFTAEHSADRPLLVYGFSYGARAAIFAAEKSPEIAGVIVEGPFISAREWFKRQFHWPFAPPMPDRNLLKAARTVSDRPLLVLVGESDHGITPEEAKALLETSHHPASVVHVFPSTGHAVFTPANHKGYVEIVQTFLRALVEEQSED